MYEVQAKLGASVSQSVLLLSLFALDLLSDLMNELVRFGKVELNVMLLFQTLLVLYLCKLMLSLIREALQLSQLFFKLFFTFSLVLLFFEDVLSIRLLHFGKVILLISFGWSADSAILHPFRQHISDSAQSLDVSACDHFLSSLLY